MYTKMHLDQNTPWSGRYVAHYPKCSGQTEKFGLPPPACSSSRAYITLVYVKFDIVHVSESCDIFLL